MKEYTPVPQDAFQKICEIYVLNQELVKNEYILFKAILKDLDIKLLSKVPNRIHADSDEDESNSDQDESGGE